ncbi:MAG: hypothetical protein FJ088_04980, partial [Deltaproteobacteria bacterium]|nr:hypothetical protein [Deltaproteobacteria bacterium]
KNGAGPWLHGLAFECGINLKNRLKLTSKIEGSGGSGKNAFSFGMILPDIYGVAFSMNYIKRNFTEVYNMFNPEDSLFASEARIPLAGNFFVFGQFFQDFAVAKKRESRGSYIPRQSFFAGIGYGNSIVR